MGGLTEACPPDYIFVTEMSENADAASFPEQRSELVALLRQGF